MPFLQEKKMHDGQRKKDKATISHKKIWMSQTIVGKQR
jgi:hypothetical protein